MDTQPMRWWNGQNETTRRLGSGLAVCGTVVGALYMIVQTAPTERAMRIIDDSGRITISSGGLLDHLGSNGVQVAVDASPAQQVMSVPIPQPSPLAAAKSSAPAKKVASRIDAVKTSVAASGGVERFDRCLPQCETRDPLISGYPQYAEAEPSLVRDDDPPPVVDERGGFRPLAGARHILTKAVDAPGVLLRRGRETLDNVARLDW
ncbi:MULTISPECIES: hypothetical protein [unclassified Rhizobium]|uniref:hypothetical protein n=1 Tax=unclassified Rhizobium TaxID=2613769 RepID=UPI000EA90B08|nr:MULTISPECIES: hypothetical protein [unclassified Rhizobium]AYG68856.1 hypothetical protein CCGE531_22525 [Rhizobium sp. CCGE531]AYG75243.1 hypothetical protein CCGE532_22010 [Rhizobium sp. CCGE532]